MHENDLLHKNLSYKNNNSSANMNLQLIACRQRDGQL